MQNPNIDNNAIDKLMQLILQNTIQTNSIFDSFSTPPKKIKNIRIEKGEEIPVNEYKKRLFSDIEYDTIRSGMTNVKKAIHHINLKNVYAYNNKLIIESSNFSDFHQKMIYDYNEKTIEFILIQPNNTQSEENNELDPEFYYKSKYKIIFDKKNKIVLDPYTTKKIIKPIIYEEFINKKLNSTKYGPVNVFKYIIDNSDIKDKEKINNFIKDLSYEKKYVKIYDLFRLFNHYLQIIKNKEGLDMDIYNNVKFHLKDTTNLLKHMTQLKKWKKLYNTLYNDTKNIYNIEYKCVYEKKFPNKYKNNEYKGYYSKENIKLLSLVKNYFDHDKQLELEDDTIQMKVRDQTVFEVGSKDSKQECEKGNIKPRISKESTELKESTETKIKDINADSYFIKKVDNFIWIDHPIKTSKNIGDFGIYTPYLVSYILRDPQSKKLNINGSNIIEFCEFIHGFKSAGLSLVSLMLQLVDSYINYKNIYNINSQKMIDYTVKIDHIKKMNNKNKVKSGNCKKELKNPSEPKLINLFTKIIIKFSYKKIYSSKIEYPTYIDHNIIFDLSELSSNNYLKLSILQNEIQQNEIQQNDKQDVLNLKFIELDEPYYGPSENSNINDFDELFINRITSNYSNADIVYNINEFNKKMNYVDSKLDEKEQLQLQLQLPVPNLDNFDDFPQWPPKKPSIKQTSIIPPSIIPPSKKQTSIIPLVFNKYDGENGKFQSSSGIYKQKYLKYKLKYMKLNNL
jgi:hypothetical protein